MTGRHAPPGQDRDRPAAEIRAAGAVLYRYGDDGMQVAVIHRPSHDDWSFPKGKLEPGEHVLLAAVREVTEETGIRPVLGRPLATVRYQVEGRPKRVDYWASRVDDPAAQPAFVPGDEVDQLTWLPVPEAIAMLTYAHDVSLLRRLVAPPGDGLTGGDTVPCVLLRHASAGRKSAWRGDDLLRPLDERGEADAAELARLLGCFGVTRVLSSAAERCLGTVRPYAKGIGAAIEAEPAFTARPGDGGGDRTEAARRRLAELLKDPVPTVICGHRENLPVLYAQARDTLRQPPPDDGWSPPKAGFWVLHVAADILAAVEHHPVTS